MSKSFTVSSRNTKAESYIHKTEKSNAETDSDDLNKWVEWSFPFRVIPIGPPRAEDEDCNVARHENNDFEWRSELHDTVDRKGDDADADGDAAEAEGEPRRACAVPNRFELKRN